MTNKEIEKYVFLHNKKIEPLIKAMIIKRRTFKHSVKSD